MLLFIDAAVRRKSEIDAWSSRCLRAMNDQLKIVVDVVFSCTRFEETSWEVSS